jgi:hypothetical protein
MKKYQLNKLELARIEALHELQQERLIDLHTGDISQEDYDNWYGYNQLNRLIPQIKEELDAWDNRGEVPFMHRPTFEPVYTRKDLAEFELKLGVYDMSFVPPKPYSNME